MRGITVFTSAADDDDDEEELGSRLSEWEPSVEVVAALVLPGPAPSSTEDGWWRWCECGVDDDDDDDAGCGALATPALRDCVAPRLRGARPTSCRQTGQLHGFP